MAANAIIAVAKFLAGAVTSSSAMFSEGIHSLIDTADGGLLLVGQRLATKPADRQYPFGHGREVFFWSFAVAILIFAVGGGVSIYEGIHRLRNPEPLAHAVWIYAVLGVAAVFESISFTISLRHFFRRKGDTPFVEAVRRSKNPPDFMIVFEDGAALVGIAVAAIGVSLELWTGNPLYDGAASVLIGLLLATIATLLAIETRGLLMGEAVNAETADAICKLIEGDVALERAGDPLTSYVGPESVVLNIEIEFRPGLETAELEAAIKRIEHSIRERWPQICRVFIGMTRFSGPER